MTPFIRLPVLTLSTFALAAPVPGVVSAQALTTIETIVIQAGDFGSKKFTDLLVNTLGSAKQFCGALDKSYQVDCLAERIAKMASDIPEGTDYDEVKQVLDSTSREMSSLARANRDLGKPRQNVSVGGKAPQATTRPLTAVKTANLASVNQQAEAILARTETLLLRTPEDEGGKKLHYARIAEAIGSNKTLLRSA